MMVYAPFIRLLILSSEVLVLRFAMDDWEES
jgi:hypothetical protein